MNRLDLVGFDKNDKHFFPFILEYSNMEPWHGLGALISCNNMIRLTLSVNLSAVKGLIQSASPLNDCFIAETNFEDIKSVYCK